MRKALAHGNKDRYKLHGSTLSGVVIAVDVEFQYSLQACKERAFIRIISMSNDGEDGRAQSAAPGNDCAMVDASASDK